MGAPGAVQTFTVTVAVAVPPGPVAVSVYTVVTCGVTPVVPAGGSVPGTPEIATLVALSVVQSSVVVCPALIDAGVAVKRVTVGGGGRMVRLSCVVRTVALFTPEKATCERPSAAPEEAAICTTWEPPVMSTKLAGVNATPLRTGAVHWMAPLRPSRLCAETVTVPGAPPATTESAVGATERAKSSAGRW
jgi:hypothetical protein